MDDLVHDPELAQGLVKLLNDKLKEARKALEESQKNNAEVRSELDRLQRLPGGDPRRRSDEDKKLQETKRALESAEQTIAALRRDNSDLRGVIEGFRAERERSRMISSPEQVSCSGSCETVLQLETQINHLKQRVENLNVERRQLQTECAQSRRQLATSEDSVREEKKAVDELREQIKVLTSEFEDKERALNQELEQARQKHQHYKRQFSDCHRDLQKREVDLAEALDKLSNTYHPRPRSNFIETVPEQFPMSPSSNPPVSPTIPRSPSSHRQIDTRREPRHDGVERALANPCLPLSKAGTLQSLPSRIRNLMGSSTVLHVPDQTIYPTSTGRACILAAQSLCTSETLPLHFGPPRDQLVRLAPGTHELFVNTPSGICYAGTFASTGAVRVLPPREVAGLSPVMQESVAMSAFVSRSQYFRLSNHARDRLKEMYVQGTAVAEELELRCVGFNEPLWHALLDMRTLESKGSLNQGGARRTPEGPGRKRQRSS